MNNKILVVSIVSLMLSCSAFAQEDKVFCPDENHPHVIDLGMPSGTQWACCNVDADSPVAFGGYYAWGEKTEKSNYTGDTYQYATWNRTKGDYEWEDLGASISGSQYDVATEKWGSSWCLPTSEQMDELLRYTTHSLYTEKGVQGIAFTGENGNSLFVPFAGARQYKQTSYVGSYCFFWSGSSVSSSPSRAYLVRVFPNGYAESLIDFRYFGLSVRPVNTTPAKAENVLVGTSATDGTRYTIDGRKIGSGDTLRVGQGIYIQGGKKYTTK